MLSHIEFVCLCAPSHYFQFSYQRIAMMTTFTRTGAMPLARTGRPAVPTSVRTHRGQFSSSVLHKGCDVVIKRAPGRASVQPKAMFSGLGKFFKGDPSKKTQERLQPIVDAVNALESNMQKLSDDELKGMTQKLKQRVAAGESLEDVRAEAFAVRTLHLLWYSEDMLMPAVGPLRGLQHWSSMEQSAATDRRDNRNA